MPPRRPGHSIIDIRYKIIEDLGGDRLLYISSSPLKFHQDLREARDYRHLFLIDGKITAIDGIIKSVNP